jgi:hypothetical protein
MSEMKIETMLISIELGKIKKSNILEHFRERLKINYENEIPISLEISSVYSMLLELDKTFREEDRNRVEAFIKNVYYWVYTTDNFDSGFLDTPMEEVKRYYVASMYAFGYTISDIPGYSEVIDIL